MKKTFFLILLTLLTLGLFRPITALAEEQKLPSGIDRNQVGQKIKTMSRSMKEDDCRYGNSNL